MEREAVHHGVAGPQGQGCLLVVPQQRVEGLPGKRPLPGQAVGRADQRGSHHRHGDPRHGERPGQEGEARGTGQGGGTAGATFDPGRGAGKRLRGADEGNPLSTSTGGTGGSRQVGLGPTGGAGSSAFAVAQKIGCSRREQGPLTLRTKPSEEETTDVDPERCPGRGES